MEEIIKEYTNSILVMLLTSLISLIGIWLKKELARVLKGIELQHHKHSALIAALQHEFDNGFSDHYNNVLNQRLKESNFINSEKQK